MRAQPYPSGAEVTLTRGGTRRIASAFYCPAEQRWYFRFVGGGSACESEILSQVYKGAEKASLVVRHGLWLLFDRGRKYIK